MTATSLLPKIAAGQGHRLPPALRAASSSAPRSRPEPGALTALLQGCGQKLARRADPGRACRRSACPESSPPGTAAAAPTAQLSAVTRAVRRTVRARPAAARRRSPPSPGSASSCDAWALPARRASRSRTLNVSRAPPRDRERSCSSSPGSAPGQNLCRLDPAALAQAMGAAPVGAHRRGDPAACPTPLRRRSRSTPRWRSPRWVTCTSRRRGRAVQARVPRRDAGPAALTGLARERAREGPGRHRRSPPRGRWRSRDAYQRVARAAARCPRCSSARPASRWSPPTASGGACSGARRPWTVKLPRLPRVRRRAAAPGAGRRRHSPGEPRPARLGRGEGLEPGATARSTQ